MHVQVNRDDDAIKGEDVDFSRPSFHAAVTLFCRGLDTWKAHLEKNEPVGKQDTWKTPVIKFTARFPTVTPFPSDIFPSVFFPSGGFLKSLTMSLLRITAQVASGTLTSTFV